MDNDNSHLWQLMPLLLLTPCQDALAAQAHLCQWDSFLSSAKSSSEGFTWLGTLHWNKTFREHLSCSLYQLWHGAGSHHQRDGNNLLHGTKWEQWGKSYSCSQTTGFLHDALIQLGAWSSVRALQEKISFRFGGSFSYILSTVPFCVKGW